MPALNNLGIPFLVAAMTLTSLTHASAAPAELEGKTITISWTEIREEKVDSLDSNMTSFTIKFSLKAYVSEKGRTFTRMTRAGGPGGGPGRGHSDQGPTDQNSLGSAGTVSFSGQRMTLTRTFKTGARQVSAVFDTGFAGCRAQIVVGKQGGTGFLAATSMTGRKEYIFSSSVSSESCSVAPGNGLGP